MKLISKRKQLRIIKKLRHEGETFYRIVVRNKKFWIKKEVYQQLPLGLDFTINQFAWNDYGLTFKKNSLNFVIFHMWNSWY